MENIYMLIKTRVYDATREKFVDSYIKPEALFAKFKKMLEEDGTITVHKTVVNRPPNQWGS